jgi:hypothetical protein
MDHLVLVEEIPLEILQILEMTMEDEGVDDMGEVHVLIPIEDEDQIMF